MNLQQLYEDFRSQYPEIANATDVRHENSCFGFDYSPEVQSVWFESLADVLNDRMRNPEQRDEIIAVFKYMDKSLRIGNKEVKNCIDVCFVENLFHNVPRQTARSIWGDLPGNLQKLYLDVFNYSANPF